jgi:hypothetical protein
MSEFNVIAQKIIEMEKEYFELKNSMENLIAAIKKEKKYLQEICNHEFITEKDDDYHKPGVVYVCKFCQYFSHQRPHVLGTEPNSKRSKIN